MWLLRQLPREVLPYIEITLGIFLVLCGTVLYWPAERLGERMDQNEKYQRDWAYRNTRRVSLWIKNDPMWRLIFRTATVLCGVFGIGWGVWLIVR